MSTISMDNIPQQTPATPAEAPNISLQDLQNLLIVIDLASRRGAFGAQELSQIGALFDKLNTFLAQVAPPPAQDQAQPATPAAAAPSPVMPMTPPFSPKVGI